MSICRHGYAITFTRYQFNFIYVAGCAAAAGTLFGGYLMVCIYCGGKTKVTNSRPQKRMSQTWRRRECLSCAAVFTTLEAVDYAGSLRVRTQNGSLQPFERDKLFMSLYKALGHRTSPTSDASALTATIIARTREIAQNGLLERTDIIQVASQTLQRFDAAAAVQYSAYHQN